MLDAQPFATALFPGFTAFVQAICAPWPNFSVAKQGASRHNTHNTIWSFRKTRCAHWVSQLYRIVCNSFHFHIKALSVPALANPRRTCFPVRLRRFCLPSLISSLIFKWNTFPITVNFIPFFMQAILLAAGFGTRLKPYTNLRPKPLFPVLNRPLLHQQLERLVAIGCDPIIVNAHHLGGQMKAALAAWPAVRLQYEDEILGTGGSLRQALPNLKPEPVLVANADVCHEVSLQALYQHHLESGNAVTMALHDLPRFNTVQTDGSRVRHFKGGAGSLAFTGLQVVNPEVIARIPQGAFFHIIDLYEELAASGTIGLMRVDSAFWRDMGTPEDYLLLHQALLPLVPQRGQWLIESSAVVEPGVELRGWGCIGAGARIGTGAALENCVIWDGAQIPAQTRQRFRILTGDTAVDEEPGQNAKAAPETAP